MFCEQSGMEFSQIHIWIINKIIIVISAATEKSMCAMKMLTRATALPSKGNCTCAKALRWAEAWVLKVEIRGSCEAGVIIVNDEAGVLGRGQIM